MSDQTDLKKELITWRRRLQKRREQKALFGILADPSIDLEIEDIETTIEELQARLVESGPTRVPSPPVAAPPVADPPTAELAVLRAKPRLFLCHASEDKARVKQLYHQLKETGYRPWLDKFDLLPGQRWRPAIKEIITDPDNLILVCLSNNSITKQGVIQQEIKWALDILAQMPEESIYLIPVRLEVCPAPEQLAELHWVDLFETDGFDYLSRALDYEIRRRQNVPKPESQQLQAKETQEADDPPTAPLPSKRSPLEIDLSGPVRNIMSQAAEGAHRGAKLATKLMERIYPTEPEMILIPASLFLMGSDPQQDPEAWDNEYPQHKLYLPDYAIAKIPITNVQYAVFGPERTFCY